MGNEARWGYCNGVTVFHLHRILSVAHEMDKSQTDVLTKCAQHLKRLGQVSRSHLLCGLKSLSHLLASFPRLEDYTPDSSVFVYFNPGSQGTIFMAMQSQME